MGEDQTKRQQRLKAGTRTISDIEFSKCRGNDKAASNGGYSLRLLLLFCETSRINTSSFSSPNVNENNAL